MTDEPKYRDEEWLREQYVNRERSTTDIADECGCSTSTVSKWLNKHNVETRGVGSPLADSRLTDRLWLRKQYVDKNESIPNISSECGCSLSTVHKWLNRHNIDTESQPQMSGEPITDPEWLHRQYVDKQENTFEIADKAECSQPTVLDWLNKHGIDTREPGHDWPAGPNHPQWNGGRFPYGPGWNEHKRQTVRERDSHTCQDPRCSVTQDDHLDQYGEKLHVHHLRKAREIEDAERRNATENLITLCRDCHRRWEKMSEAGLVPEVVEDD